MLGLIPCTNYIYIPFIFILRYTFSFQVGFHRPMGGRSKMKMILQLGKEGWTTPLGGRPPDSPLLLFFFAKLSENCIVSEHIPEAIVAAI